MEGPGLVEKTYDSHKVRVLWFAIVLVLLILVTWYLKVLAFKGENLIGGGVQDKVFTSGATQRFAQEMSQPGQGQYTTVRNAEIKEILPGVIPGRSERLTASREAPVFYDVSDMLGAYQGATSRSDNPEDDAEFATIAAATTPYGNLPVDATATTASAGSVKSEHLADHSPAAVVQEELLRRSLY